MLAASMAAAGLVAAGEEPDIFSRASMSARSGFDMFGEILNLVLWFGW